MENGELIWRTENGEWRINFENGEWRMENGELIWRTENGRRLRETLQICTKKFSSFIQNRAIGGVSILYSKITAFKNFNILGFKVKLFKTYRKTPLWASRADQFSNANNFLFGCKCI